MSKYLIIPVEQIENRINYFIEWCESSFKDYDKNSAIVNELKDILANNKSISEEEIEQKAKDLADNWVFEINGYKWSNNNNEAGDNFGSFKEGYIQCFKDIIK